MKTEKLRRLNKQNTEMLVNLHDDIYDVCVTLLEQRGYFILEDVIIRADKRKLRDEVQWKVMLKWLEEHFGEPLASHHRASLYRMAKAAFNPLPVTKEVKDKYLAPGRGNSNQIAGYGFMGWPDRQTSERKIAARYHQGDGLHQVADRMQLSLQQREQMEEIEARKDLLDQIESERDC